MGLFVIEAKDKPDAFALRQATRPDHLAFLSGLGDALVLAGPFQDDEGRANGSMVVIKAETKAEAEAIAARDPYAEAGLFADVSIRAWVWALNKPEHI